MKSASVDASPLKYLAHQHIHHISPADPVRGVVASKPKVVCQVAGEGFLQVFPIHGGLILPTTTLKLGIFPSEVLNGGMPL